MRERRFQHRLRDFDPDQLRRLTRLGLYARQVVEGFIAGQHRGRAMGWNVEFADYREYVKGDDLRALDWKVYARTDKHFIRRYEEETSMRVYLALDTSASMGYGPSGRAKLDAAALLAASLAYLLIRQRDAVGLFTFAEKLGRHLPARDTSEHLRRIWTELERLHPRGKTSIGGTLRSLSAYARRRGLLVLISDALYDADELARGLALFAHRRFDVILLQVLSPEELEFPFHGDAEFVDLESAQRLTTTARAVRGAYLEAMEAHLLAVRGECARLGADYHLHRTDAPIETSLGMFLERRRRLARG